MSKSRKKGPVTTKKIGRSAKTGKFVKRSFADSHPSTTVVETIKTGKSRVASKWGRKYTVREVARSAKTGRFVHHNYASSHPSTTIVEKIKFGKSLDTGTIDGGPKGRKK